MSPETINAIFKAYDVRGIYPKQIDASVAQALGEAYAGVSGSKKVAVGRDVRQSGEELKTGLVKGLLSCGVDVVDIGVISTDQLYFAVGKYGYDGGISVTASHNPGEYNGFKFAQKGGAPIDSERLTAIRDKILRPHKELKGGGKLTKRDIFDDYINHLLKLVDTDQIKPLDLVVNANFGAVGKSIDAIAQKLRLKLERLNWERDGTFPKGPPNPLLPENRQEIVALIEQHQPDFGVAWDADADRVFFYTGKGEFIPSAYIIALLSEEFLRRFPKSKIVHDATLCWLVDDAITAGGGQPVLNRVGHTFIKARMRQEDSPFAGESSGHYYFRDTFSADNGILPFLMILEIVSKRGQSLAGLIKPYQEKYFMIDETNFETKDIPATLTRIEEKLGRLGEISKIDGLTVESDNWRFNVRPSNTEPLLRLNAEAKSRQDLDEIVAQVKGLIT